MTIGPGTKLGRYEMRSQIGAGGMGEVYLAKATKLARKVVFEDSAFRGCYESGPHALLDASASQLR
jgi:serine/threonine protein kinase